MWVAILVAAGIAFALKLAGHLVPVKVLDEPHVKRVTAALPIALLAALVATQTFTGAGGLVLDARAAAVGLAVIALLLRAPFILVVVLGALTAALLRLAGLG
jgi:hypothetical protein